jgi:hypothetical protein
MFWVMPFPESATNSRSGGMSKTPGRGQGHALLAIADLKKEFWLHVTFLLIACTITTFDKIHLSTLLSDLPMLISSCAACMSERVVKNEPKFF